LFAKVPIFEITFGAYSGVHRLDRSGPVGPVAPAPERGLWPEVPSVGPVRTGRTGGHLLQKSLSGPGAIGRTGAAPVGPVANWGVDPQFGRGYLPLPSLSHPSTLSFFFKLPPSSTSLLSSPTHIHPPNPNLQGKGTKDSWWGTSPPHPPPSGPQVCSFEKRGKLLFSRYKSYPRPISF
jgi:hypothetical protein